MAKQKKLTSKELIAKLGISESTFFRCIQEGRIQKPDEQGTGSAPSYWYERKISKLIKQVEQFDADIKNGELISVGEVAKIIKRSSASIYRDVRVKKFPSPINHPLNDKKAYWRKSEIEKANYE